MKRSSLILTHSFFSVGRWIDLEFGCDEKVLQKTLDSTAEKFTRTLDETAATLKKAINEKETPVVDFISIQNYSD